MNDDNEMTFGEKYRLEKRFIYFAESVVGDILANIENDWGYIPPKIREDYNGLLSHALNQLSPECIEWFETDGGWGAGYKGKIITVTDLELQPPLAMCDFCLVKKYDDLDLHIFWIGNEIETIKKQVLKHGEHPAESEILDNAIYNNSMYGVHDVLRKLAWLIEFEK